MLSYKLVWDDFCSWYLEMIKPAYQQPIDAKTYDEVNNYFEQIVKVLHPFMPFISEEIWQLIGKREQANEALIVAEWPAVVEVDYETVKAMESCKEIVSGVRNIRKQNNIPNKQAITIAIKNNKETLNQLDPVITKLCNASELTYVDEKLDNAFSFMVASNEYFIPFGDHVNVDDEIKKLEEELRYTEGFLNTVNKKLANERFVSGAPEQVVNAERKKQADAETKIKLISEKLASLKVK